ncbi:MAG: KilA-N domain-containing protein [Paludibacteraceae bacterium]|nr:KilA-N domain-containing protein [Paludibacteraceae bacterium]
MAVRKINIDESEISVIFGMHDDDYICLTDMVKAGDNSDRTNIVIQNWMRRKDTISYLGVWENLHNPNFKSIEFDAIRNASGTNRFILTAKEWIERTNAIGIIAKSGRYGGTYAHKDIAYHFGMWLSPEFNLLVVKEFQRLKEEEQKALGWSAKRELAKINYHIHTDAIKANLVPQEIDTYHRSLIYANEADVLNVALFGMTAKEWRDAHPDDKGNIRDYATINQLICLSNMENLNAVFINEGMPQQERLHKLNQIAIQQMTVLENVESRKILNA